MEELTKKLTEAIGLSDPLAIANEKPGTEEVLSYPEWSKSPHSEVSHLALSVGALGSRVDGVGHDRRGPGQVINAPLPSQLSKRGSGSHVDQAASLTEGTATIAPARIGRLRAAHAEAVAELEDIRKQPGQLTNGINAKVGNSILEAGIRALADISDEVEPKQFVVAAPPGTGKTSHAIALMTAVVRSADQQNLSKPYGCLFVVDQIKKADDMFQRTKELLPGKVAVWTSDHDVNSTAPTQLYILPEFRFDIDQLQQRAVAIVTQAFMRGPHGPQRGCGSRKSHTSVGKASI